MPMNFLAHVYLSGTSGEIQVGNFIGDYVKGNAYLKYPEEIKKGIILHRAIDNFTDNHPVVNASKSHIKDRYKRYSGIVVDIFYDHYLASEWDNFSTQALPQYVKAVVRRLVKNYLILPAKVKKFLPYFLHNKWYELYTSIAGIKTVLARMSNRTSLPDETEYAIKILTDNYQTFREEFYTFFPQIINYVKEDHNIIF